MDPQTLFSLVSGEKADNPKINVEVQKTCCGPWTVNR
jgi:hypothetical protein